MTGVAVYQSAGGDWHVNVGSNWAAGFKDKADAEAWAEAKRAELAKAQPYYVDGAYVTHATSGHAAVVVAVSQMPNGTPQVWQRKLLALCADLLNGGDLNDPRFKGVE